MVNGMVEQYQEDKVDPSATQLKIAELQDWDEDRLILGSKLISEGKSLKKAAREVRSLHGRLFAAWSHTAALFAADEMFQSRSAALTV